MLHRGRYFDAGIGVDLGLAHVRTAGLQNLASLYPILARPNEVGDRDALLRLLVGRLRHHLASGMDLGVLTLLTALLACSGRAGGGRSSCCCGTPCPCGSATSAPSTRWGPSCANLLVEEVFSAGPSWPPVGLTLLANQFHYLLHLQATYTPDCVPDELADAFLDFLVADLDG